MFSPQLTKDGSFTFFSEEFDEAFHSHSGARQEAQQKFVEPCQLAEKAKHNHSLQILDICYGLGYNTAAALATIWTANLNCEIKWIGLELEPNVFRQAIAYNLLETCPPPIPHLLGELAAKHRLEIPQFNAELLIGDARNTIQKVYSSGFQADAIFLDPFSPPKCPQLWTVEFLALVAKCLKSDGRLATYSCAASVRTALLLAGLAVGTTGSVGRKSPGTVANFANNELFCLSLKELEHLQTRAAIPYRDPQLNNSAKTIIQQRQEEQKLSLLEPSSHWKKRWLRMS